MIIDTFTFNTEFDLLEARLEYLDDIVDYFIIVETTCTFKGVAKELNFPKNLQRYKTWLHKIIYRPYVHEFQNLDLDYKPTDTDYTSAHWEIEMAQREYITTMLGVFQDSDYVMVSDLDEIPSKQGIHTAIQHLPGNPAIGFRQMMFYYNLKQHQLHPWHGSVISTVGFTKTHGAQWLRDHRSSVPFVYDGGWHLSYWMSPEQIRRKVLSFAHQEVNREPFTNLDHIRAKIAQGQDLFDRENPFVPVNPDTLDPEFVSIVSRYERSHVDHVFQNIPGVMSEEHVSFVKFILGYFSEPAHLVELCSGSGKCASMMATEIHNSGEDIRLDCVDLWTPDTLSSFLQATHNVSEKIRMIQSAPQDAVRHYLDNSLDFLFINAQETPELIRTWLPKIKRRGIISGRSPVMAKATLGSVIQVGDIWYRINHS